jgi:hypothetical protein
LTRISLSSYVAGHFWRPSCDSLVPLEAGSGCELSGMWDFWGYFSHYSISQILASCILVFCCGGCLLLK